MKQLFIVSFTLASTVILSSAQKQLTDCLKPWQKPVLSVATISEPAAPLRCHPETDPCPQNGAATECQFSFRSFMYVCCEDREDVRAPVCPKYHDTLNTFCGGSRSVCPKGYKCMRSRYDPKVELCCRPNPRKIHPEPETSFVDHSVTPMILPKAPKKILSVVFEEKNLTIGQLVSNDEISGLQVEPQLYALGLDDKLYTALMFDMTDGGDESILLWFAPDVPSYDGKLAFSKQKKIGISYHGPTGNEFPYGTHIVVAVLFEQKDYWPEKDVKKLNAREKVNIKAWLNSSSNILVREPVAGTIFGFTSVADDTDENVEVPSSTLF
ncbi:unnamed protein product [Enterobius vermicularis]|uniref:Secreted protein n=1 Tax=Enterobius vermicularis TaxID=51028 RepID=A0A0N4V0W7_ENTVE|nr:unnamed protein product [Enterobius vermicularis]